MSQPQFNRLPLSSALAEWKKCLADHGYPVEMVWIFAENLCVEPAAAPGSFAVHFQTRFTPPPDDALEIAYDQFCETGARMVFYRLGSANGKSVCVLLCDPWFESKSAPEGFERRDDWGISFRAGGAEAVEEVADLARWLQRVQRNRAFHDFDFAMSLATIDEIKIHGRVLQPYERFAENLLNRLRRVLGNPP
jgi:hypothetical protein